MLGAVWMQLSHEEAERKADKNAKKAQKAMEEAPDLSQCSRRAEEEHIIWEQKMEIRWAAEGRINRYGMLKVSSKPPDRSARLLYHLFKATRGTRRKEGISRTQARDLRQFLYG